MGTDYGKYNDDVWDLVEFRDGIIDVKVKHENTEIYAKLETAQKSIQEAINILVKKSEDEQSKMGTT